MTHAIRQQSPATGSEHAHEPVSDGYWLRHCHGFRVDTPRGRLGIVEDVLYGAEHDEPSALAVRGGVLGRRRELVPVETVDSVEPSRKRPTLASQIED